MAPKSKGKKPAKAAKKVLNNPPKGSLKEAPEKAPETTETTETSATPTTPEKQQKTSPDNASSTPPDKTLMEPPNVPKKTPKESSSWHPDPPLGFGNKVRFDRIPNSNPLGLLFNRLPSPHLDFEAAWDPSARDYLDKSFVFVLWGFANSDRAAVVSSAGNPQTGSMAGWLWDMTRDAFTLEDVHDLNQIKNYFLQGLAQLIVHSPTCSALIMLAGPATPGVPGGRVPWGMVAEWMAVGRSDKDSLGHIREEHDDRNELHVINTWACQTCKCRIEEQVLFCSLCSDHEFKQMNGVRYCHKDCQDWEWEIHQKACSRRRFFFRGAEIFKRIAHDFAVVTYSNRPRDVVSIVSASFQASNAETTNTGQETSGILHFGRLAWDQPDIYAILRPLISNIFKGLCEQISILKVYIRNARDVIVRTNDPAVEPGITGRIAGKQPIFHPHSVLYLRIKGGEEVIIDLHSTLFGFATDVVPFSVFIRSRTACIISITDALDASRTEEWAPECMRETQRDRHELMAAFLRRLKVLIRTECKAKNVQSSVCQISHLKEPLYKDIRDKIYAFSRDTLDGLHSDRLPYHRVR